MESRRFLASFLIGSAFAWAARESGTVEQAANRAEQLAAQTNSALRPAFRVLAAQALHDRYPALAEKFVRAALEDVRTRDLIDPELLSILTAVAPEETIALLPHLKPGSDRVVINALLRSDQVRRATALYRASLGNGQPRVDGMQLFRLLAKESPEDAKKLFADTMAAFSFEASTPNDFYSLINCAVAIAPVAPQLAADVYERVIAVASSPDYEKKSSFSATFQIGSSRIVTQNPRDTLLVAAGARLHSLAPDIFDKHKDILSRWDLTGAWKSMMPSAPGMNTAPTPERAISERMGQLRSMPDADRPKAVLELAHAIQGLPKESNNLASNLANLATEGDNGKEAMDAVAATLGQEIREGAPSARGYVELAKLIRYEHTRPPFTDPSLDAADALLALRERVYQGNGFRLTSMDGKTYSLDGLRGKVVLLNFWATWCPPCRKEMPDMETLSRRFEKQGLVVLAVSDEERETVSAFLAKQKYTFPVLLDPARKVNNAFGVEGIPKSFIFDREGKLVAQAIDMRTERQFLELLKEAGLQ